MRDPPTGGYNRSERGDLNVFVATSSGRTAGVVGLALAAVFVLGCFRFLPPWLPPEPDTEGVLLLGLQVFLYGLPAVLGLSFLRLALRPRRLEIRVQDGVLRWLDGRSGAGAGSVPVKDILGCQVLLLPPAAAGAKSEVAAVMIDVVDAPTILLPRGVARAAASEEFVGFLKKFNPDVAREEREISGARELHELRNRIARMRAAGPRR